MEIKIKLGKKEPIAATVTDWNRMRDWEREILYN